MLLYSRSAANRQTINISQSIQVVCLLSYTLVHSTFGRSISRPVTRSFRATLVKRSFIVACKNVFVFRVS